MATLAVPIHCISGAALAGEVTAWFLSLALAADLQKQATDDEPRVFGDMQSGLSWMPDRHVKEHDLGPDHGCGAAHSLLIETVEEQIAMNGI